MNSRCVVLVPVGHSIEPDCDDALRELERRGYVVRLLRGCSAIDQARSLMASEALRDGFDELMWIDADIAFSPDDVDKLRARDLPFVCGIYPKKTLREISSLLLADTPEVTFGEQGGLLAIRYAAMGFVYTRRAVYEDVRARCELPACGQGTNMPLVPYFLPMVVPSESGHAYLGEDYAFSERARRAGYEIMADTTIRLAHIGRYGYCWEDVGSMLPRFATYRVRVAASPPASSCAAANPSDSTARG